MSEIEITAEDLFNQAEELEDEDPEKALELCDKAIAKSASCTDAWLLKASLYQDLNKPEDAFKTLNEACQRNPQSAECWFDTGAFLFTHRSYGQAVQCFARVKEINPDYPRVNSNLGISLLKIGDFQDAAENLANAIGNASNNIDKAHLYSHLGEAYLGLEDFDKAIENFDKSLQFKDNDYTVIAKMAMALCRKNDPEQALGCLNSAIELAPKEGKLYIIKGQALHMLGKNDEAELAYSKAQEISPADPEVILESAKYLISLEKLDEALAKFDQGIELNPDDATFWFHKARLLHDMKKEEEAIETHRRGLAMSGRLVAWGLFLAGDDKKPVDGTKVAVETDIAIPREEIVKQYINSLVKKGHKIDKQGLVDGKYHIGITQIPPEALRNSQGRPSTMTKEDVFKKRLELAKEGRLAVWELMISDDDKQPIEGSQITIEADSQIPPEQIVKQYAGFLMQKGHKIENSLVDGKYKINVRKLSEEEVQERIKKFDKVAKKSQKTEEDKKDSE